MAGIKRPSSVISKLISQADELIKKDKLSVTAACSKVGLRKETYHYRKRAQSKPSTVKDSAPVKNLGTTELMNEYQRLEERMDLIKKELAKRMLQDKKQQ